MGHADKELSPNSLPSLNSQAQLSPPMLHQHITTLKGHSYYVSALAVGRTSLYSASFDQTIRSWPLTTPMNTEISSFPVATTKSPVKSLLLSGHLLFSAHQDHKIRVWRISNNRDDHHHCKMKAALPTTADRVQSLLLPSNYVQVRRHKKCTWVHHVDAVSGLAVSADGSVLYSVSWDRSIKVWRTSDFKCMESIAHAHHDAINAIVVTKDGCIYTGSADATVKLWRKVQQGQSCKHALVQTLQQHRSGVNALALSSNGSVLYSGASDWSIVVWEKYGGVVKACGVLRGHGKAVLCLAVVGELVCSGSADRTVRVWRRGGEECYSCLGVLEGHGGAVKSLTMAMEMEMVESESSSCCGDSSGGSALVFSGGLDCNIRVWRFFL